MSGVGVQRLDPGKRDPSWPWYLRSGMYVWTNWTDSDGAPVGRIAGVVEGGARDGQSAYVACEDYPPRDGIAYDLKVTHPMFLLPCHPAKREQSEAAMRQLFPGDDAPQAAAG
jgi:hypothetical protein